MRLRSYSVSPKVVSRSSSSILSNISPFSSSRNLPPQTPPESAAATLVQESLAVQEVPVRDLFENEDLSVNESASVADMSNDSWQFAQSRRTARSTRQSSRASRRKLETTSAVSDVDVMTSIPLSAASVAETSTVDSQSSSISLDACLSTDVKPFSASSGAPYDVTMTDMQRRYIAHATLMARSLSSEQLEIRSRLLGDQLRSIARFDEVTKPTESPGSSTRTVKTVKRMKARKAKRARLTVPSSALPSSAFVDLPSPLSLPSGWNRLAKLTMMF